MYLPAPLSRFPFNSNNLGATAPSATMGTSVTPGASNAEGSWTQLLTALSGDMSGFWLRVSDGASSATQKSHLLDIGIDPAGGSSYTAIINNIVCGSSGAITTTGGGHRFFFPMRLPGGATVAARIQGVASTAGTVRVGIRAYNAQQSRPWTFPVAQYSETIGTITNSSGVTFTPGTGAPGSWVSLGTTTRDLWWWQVAYQVDNTTITAEYCWVELAFGTAGTKIIIQRRINGGTTGETTGEVTALNLLPHEAYCPVPAGTEMWVRGSCDSAPDTGYNAVAVGLGG